MGLSIANFLHWSVSFFMKIIDKRLKCIHCEKSLGKRLKEKLKLIIERAKFEFYSHNPGFITQGSQSIPKSGEGGNICCASVI